VEVKDIYYIVALATMLLGGIVTVVVTVQNMKSKIDLVNQDLANHKSNHNRLQKQVDDHEDNVNLKLEKIDSKIDELKDMMIEMRD